MSLTLDDLLLGPEDRGAIIGQTGTGKSFLAKYLLPATGKLAIIDPKRTFPVKNIADVKIYSSASKIVREKPKRFAYRPDPANLRNQDDYDIVYKYVYNMKDVTCYTDDIVGIMDKHKFPDYLQICYQMGREHKVRMLSAFQRPALVPRFLVTEAQKFFVFRLTVKDDVKRVAESVDGYTGKLPSRHHFSFIDLDKGGIQTLKLSVQ